MISVQGGKSNTKKELKVSSIIKKSYNNFVSGAICFLFAFILYSNTLNHSFVLDDYDSYAANSVVKKDIINSIPIILKTNYRYGVNSLCDNIYRPLSQIMFTIEWQISPNNSQLSHFLNVLFYAIACFLLFIVLRKYMSKVHAMIPFVITLVYITMPIHTEVVANIKSRDEIMSFFFLMLTLLFLYTWFTKNKRWKWCFLIISLLTFFLSLMSKEGVITMLFLFPLLGWYFTEAKLKSILISSLLLLIPAIAYITIRYYVLSSLCSTTTIQIITNSLVAATDVDSHFATAIMLLGKYLLISILPYQLVSNYAYNQIPIIGLSDPKFILSFFVYIIIGIYIILNFRKKKPEVFGFLFFLITISIYSNIFFLIGTSFGERLIFIPSLGLCISLVFIIAQWLKIGINNETQSTIEVFKTKPFFTVIFLIILLAYSIKTIVRAAEWKNENTLFSNDLKRSPNSAQMNIWMGNILFDKAEKEEDNLKKETIMHNAVKHFEKGLSIYSSFYECYSQLGLAFLELGNVEKAKFYIDNAIKYDTSNAMKWSNIGLFYDRIGEYQKAITFDDKAINLNNNYADAYYNRALAKDDLQDIKGAIDDYNKAIQINPKYLDAYYNMGVLKYKIKDYKGAIADYTKAIKINPYYAKAYNNRGFAKHYIKDYSGAIIDYNIAIQINPNFDFAYNNRGLAEENLNGYQDAINDFSKAIEIKPNFSNAYFNLGNILYITKQYAESIDEFKKCLQYDPDNINACNNIGISYQKLNKPEEAKLYFDKVKMLAQKPKK